MKSDIGCSSYIKAEDMSMTELESLQLRLVIAIHSRQILCGALYDVELVQLLSEYLKIIECSLGFSHRYKQSFL
jgi:hypothetical protein